MFPSSAPLFLSFAFVKNQSLRYKHRFSNLLDQQGAIIHKLLSRTDKKLKKLINPISVGVIRGIPKSTLFQDDEKIFKKRQNFLNKTFMELITDILSNGSISASLKPFDFVINQVMLPSNKLSHTFECVLPSLFFFL